MVVLLQNSFQRSLLLSNQVEDSSDHGITVSCRAVYRKTTVLANWMSFGYLTTCNVHVVLFSDC